MSSSFEEFEGERVWGLFTESEDDLFPYLELKLLWELLKAWKGWYFHVGYEQSSLRFTGYFTSQQAAGSITFVFWTDHIMTAIK